MHGESSSFNELLQQQLLVNHNLDQQISTQNSSGTLLEIPDTGRIVSSAYEQLRNAAEYAEEHLLLQRAIKRFLKRNLFVAKRQEHDLGTELIVDLTQAGYLQGMQFSAATSTALNGLINYYMTTYGRLRQAHVHHETADSWILALMSVEAESTLHPHNVQQATLLLTYHHFLQVLPRARFVDLPDSESYELCLYIAIHQAILKSDIDLIRYDMHRLYRRQLDDTAAFIRLSKQVDQLMSSQLTHALKRAVSRYGAPFRVLKSLADEQPDIAALLANKERFLQEYDQQIDQEYKQLDRRLARGLVKSILFIIITKVLIGVAIEVPYDLLVHGSIIVLPLVVNLLFPPFYMASLVAGVKLPGDANKRSIHNYMERLLYSEDRFELQLPRRRKATIATRVSYTLLFAIPIAVTIFVLHAIGFNMVQMLIFFLFFSTASFLGFRLSMLVREMELGPRQVGLFASLQNSFYLPFVTLGQWLSRKYNQVNIIALFMDVAIELPLKSLLRLVQQWINFVREKHEELY